MQSGNFSGHGKSAKKIFEKLSNRFYCLFCVYKTFKSRAF